MEQMSEHTAAQIRFNTRLMTMITKDSDCPLFPCGQPLPESAVMYHHLNFSVLSMFFNQIQILSPKKMHSKLQSALFCPGLSLLQNP